jgi:glycosyltransferase involved in cell wall biosynthesis
MRLLYLTRSCNIHDLRFLNAFTRHGVETGLACLYGDAEKLPSTLASSIHFLGNLGLSATADTIDFGQAAKSFRKLALKFSPDVVQAGPVPDGGYVAAKADLNMPWLIQPSASDVFWECEHNASALRRAVIALRACPILFADCKAVLRRCIDLAGAEITAQFVMPWGIELEEIASQQPADILYKRGKFAGKTVFVFARGLEPIYGLKTVVTAFRQVHAQHPDTVLILASDGSLRPWVDEFILSHALHDAVVPTGRLGHQELLSVFAHSDCCVSNTASDGTSISMLEAMACGLPVIVSDLHGNREWVTQGENGWRVPFCDQGALVEAMQKICNLSTAERQQIREANTTLVRAKANWNKNFVKFLDFLSCLSTQQRDEKTSHGTLPNLTSLCG